MGINGLLPALKPIAKAVHISNYKGQRAAVDGYSWLHKGAYCCAKELCEGSWTDKYVTYFLSRIQLLRSAGIEPLVVFDGGRLPIKGDEEHSRHRARAEARDKAAAHLAAGNIAAAVECYQRCVDITPAMAKQVIEELKVHGVQFVVAPYEADAQMAYLARKGDVQLIVTEDSDLLAYGCPRVLYKLDRSGSGEELSLSDLPNCPGLPLANFTSDQFLQLCVMAGCDFLAQLPGIGLKKAHGVLRKYRSFTKVVKMLRFNGTRVPPDYEVRFQLALWAFRHCRVYCPTAKALVHLAPLPAGGLGAADVDVPEALTHLEQQQQQQRLDFLGPDLSEGVARGIAEGELDPMTHKPYDLAAIFAGCRNPPPHIAALLPSAATEPHTLGLKPAGRGFSSGPVSGGRRGAASGVAAAAVGSRSGGSASRPKVGMSRRHASGGQHKTFGAAVSGKSSGAAAAGSSGGVKKRSTLGIAQYFTNNAAAGAAELQTAVAAAPNGAARQQVAAAGDAVAAAPKQNMQHSIVQALQALRQQQQQRQEQERAKQQQAMQQQAAATPEDWAMAEPTAAAAAGISETAGAGDAAPAGKRRRLSIGAAAKLVVSDSGRASCFTPAGAGDNSCYSPSPAAAISLSTENDAGSLPDQHAGSATAAAGGCRPVVDKLDMPEHDGSGQLMQQLQRQSQKQLNQPVDVLNANVVIPDSQEDAEDSGVGAAAAGVPAAAECLVGQGSHSMFSNALPDAEVAPSIELMQRAHALAHVHGLACSLRTPVLSTDSLPNCSSDMPGTHSTGDLQQQHQARSALRHRDPFAGLNVASISQGDAPQESLGISTDPQQQWQQQQQQDSGKSLGCQPTHRHQQQQHSLWQQAQPTQGSGSFGISSASGQPPSQEQQCSHPFGVQGTAAATRGAAVSALTALINGISAEQQQQQQRQQQASPAAAAGGHIMQARSRGSSRFFPGSSSSPAGSIGPADLMIDDAGSLSSSGDIPGSGSCDPIGLSGRGFAGSDSEELVQQAHCNPWARSSFPCQPQQQHLHPRTGLLGAVTDEWGMSDAEQVVAPPKAHHLALNSSSSQAWRQLKHSLRSKAGEQQQQQHVNQGLSLRSLLGRHRGIGRGFQAECTDAAVPTTADLSLGGSDPDSILGVGLDQLSPTAAMGGQPEQLHHDCNTELLLGSHQRQELLQGQRDMPLHGHRCQPPQQQQQHKSHAASPIDLDAEQRGAAAAAQAAGSGSSSGGSSSNDENAEPADPGDIHSIAHMKQYAKLATKVVKNLQKQQQQQQQQVSPLMGVGSTANTMAVAAAGASHRAADTPVGSQSFLRSNGKHSNVKGRLQQQRLPRQQRRKSLTADLASFRCDPYKLFVPVQPLSPGDEQPTGAGAADLQHAQKRRQCTDLGLDLDKPLKRGQGRVEATDGCELLNSASDGLGSFSSLGKGGSQLGSVDEEEGSLLGDHTSASRRVSGIDAARGGGIAAKPFKAPWQKVSREVAGGLHADEVSVQLADDEQGVAAMPGSGGFGAFGRFTCGASGLRTSAGGSRARMRPGSRLR